MIGMFHTALHFYCLDIVVGKAHCHMCCFLAGYHPKTEWMDLAGTQVEELHSHLLQTLECFLRLHSFSHLKHTYCKITSEEYCNDLITVCYSTKLPISESFRLSLLSQSWRKSLQCIMTISSQSLCLVPSSEYEGTKMPSIVDEVRGDWPWQKTHSNNFGWLRISYKTFKFARPSLNCSRADRTLSITK